MLTGMRRWFRGVFHRAAVEQEMAAELKDHVARYTEDLVASGVPETEARRRAAIEFGSVESAKEECRESMGLRWPDEFRRDFLYAVRVLRKSPTFTMTAVVTLSLCIGANTAIYSVVDAMLFRPLPYPQPDRLGHVVVRHRSAKASTVDGSQTGAQWELIRDNARTVDAAVFGADWSGVNIVAGDRPEYVHHQRVSAGFFRVLGVAPVVGREFTRAEDVPGGAAVAILSHHLWLRYYHADPDVIGKRVLLRGEPHTIIGVLPAGFISIGVTPAGEETSVRADIWIPLRPSRTGEGEGSNYGVLTRLRDGHTWAETKAELNVIGETAFKHNPPPPGTAAHLDVMPLQEVLAHGWRTSLYVFWGAVGGVLLIGCVNLSGLLLARGAARRRELATRLAMGSGRAAVIRQLFTEGLVLAGAGALGGLLIGRFAVGAIAFVAREYLGTWQTIAIDMRVLAATAGIALLTSVLFGLYPAFEASRVDIRSSLADGGQRSTGARNRWSRRALVAGEVALGFTLLIGAGLLIRTFAYLNSLDPGFDPEGVLTAEASLQDARYTTAAKADRLFRETLDRIRVLPGVEAAGVGLSVPYERPLNIGFKDDKGEWQTTCLIYVTPGYFDALRIRFRSGRGFRDTDSKESAPVIVVNEDFARRYLHDASPVGRQIEIADERVQIVGVVANFQQRPGWGDGGPVSTLPTVFIPISQGPDGLVQTAHTWFSPKWVVRAHGGQEGLIPAMRRIVQSVDPQLPFASFSSMDEVKMRTLAMQRFQAVLLAVLAGLALTLAAVGLYGVISTSVVERTRELGIRMALGATVVELVRSVMLTGVMLAGVGIVVGVVLARALARYMEHLVYGTTPTDTATFVETGILLLVVAVVASVLPALRVTRLNPAQTLRAE